MLKEIAGNENTDELFHGPLDHHSFDDGLGINTQCLFGKCFVNGAGIQK